MSISEDLKEKILKAAKIDEVVSKFDELKKSGSSFTSRCPKCGKEKKLSITPKKNLAKCFSCDEAAVDPLNYLIKYQNMGFVEACKWLADLYRIEIPNPEKQPKKKVRRSNINKFRDQQLKDSGLELSDIKTQVKVDEATEKEIEIYQAATINQYNEIVPGDDMVMHYLDLDGKPMTYYRLDRKGNPIGKPRSLVRVRWSNPNLHLSKDGRPIKYQSPRGSGSALWIPNVVRRKYQLGTQIDTLYIQEGEKKADKASKHGMFSVGIMGIHNLAHQKHLPKEFELIIKKCRVKNVVFVLDSDCFDLNKDLDLDKGADLRPKTFCSAVLNFRTYFYAFHNIGLNLEIYFAHVIPNNNDLKGVDDLLLHLKGKEWEEIEQLNKALLRMQGRTDWIQTYKITAWSTVKVQELWGLESRSAFVHKYRDRLKKESIFKIRGVKWRFNEKNEVEMAQPLLDQERYWEFREEEMSNGQTRERISFDYVGVYEFLKNRGYSRLHTPDGKFRFIHIDHNIVREVEPFEIKDFVMQFSENVEPKKGGKHLRNMLYRGGNRYLGPDSLSNLFFRNLDLHENTSKVQYMYFQSRYWKITEGGVEEKDLAELPGHVWREKIIDFKAYKRPDFFTDVFKIDESRTNKMKGLQGYEGKWAFDATDEFLKSDFLQFLNNTSNFHQKENPSISDALDNQQHLLSKLTAIGYLLHRYRDSGCQKAVICMDGKMTELGDSNGRSGKSLIGEALRNIVPTVYIPGKKRDLEQDRFIWEEVDERTEVVWIDDARANLDFERFFPEITGTFQIEGKGISKYSLPKEKTPKLLITTNHAIKGEGSSFKDRQVMLAFSDYYNENHKPIDDFGTLFFDEWDADQWNRQYNLMATCLSLYFRFGLIPAPDEKLEKRRLRQFMGDAFFDWIEEIYTDPWMFGRSVLKKLLFNGKAEFHGHKSFLESYPTEARYVKARKFKQLIKAYCQYKGYVLNPGFVDEKTGEGFGGRDTTGGKEWITIIRVLGDKVEDERIEGQ